MSAPSNTEQRRTAGWIPAPGEPHDRCWRCGRPTPVGVSLCDADNPGRIGAPSATQAHGTIFLGVVAGFVALALAAGYALGSAGPFGSSIGSAVTRADGGLDVVVQVTNEGTSRSTATCRVSRGGLAAPDDLVFVTDRLAPGETASFPRSIAPPATGRPPFAVDRLTVVCR